MEDKQENYNLNPLKVLVALITVVVLIAVAVAKFTKIRQAVSQVLNDLEDVDEDMAPVVTKRAPVKRPQSVVRPQKAAKSPAFDLNDRQEQIYQIIKDLGEATMRSISDKVSDVSDRTLRRDTTKLEKLGLVVQIGKTKDRVYKLRK